MHVSAQLFSQVLLFVTSWTAVYQAPLSMGFSRQEHWSGLPLPTSGDLPDLGMEPVSLMSPALAGRCFIIEPPGKPSQLGCESESVSCPVMFHSL